MRLLFKTLTDVRLRGVVIRAHIRPQAAGLLWNATGRRALETLRLLVPFQTSCAVGDEMEAFGARYVIEAVRLLSSHLQLDARRSAPRNV